MISLQNEEEFLRVNIELIDYEIGKHEPLEVLEEEDERLVLEIRRLQEKKNEDTK